MPLITLDERRAPSSRSRYACFKRHGDTAERRKHVGGHMIRQKFLVTVVALTLFAASPPMTAVGQQPPLTDNAVRASYCLGYFIAQDDFAKKQFSCPGDAAAVEACLRQKMNGAPTPADKVLRIMPYVQVTGGTHTALEVQGMQDFQRCTTELQSQTSLACYAKSEKSCFDELPPLRKDQLPLSETAAKNRADTQLRCMSDRCESKMCVKAQTCESMDFLPY
jgi:hypothetical protein